AYQMLPLTSVASVYGRAFSRGSATNSILPSRSRPKPPPRRTPNQTAPSGATAIPDGAALPSRSGYSTNFPPAKCATLLPRNSISQPPPFGSTATSVGDEPGTGRSYCVISPDGAIRITWLADCSVAHTVPSPATATP